MNKKGKATLPSYKNQEPGGEKSKVSAPAPNSWINDRHFIKYEEKTDDDAINKVLLKFDNNFLEMTKSGEVRSTLTFTEGENTEGYYKTPYGTFLIETDTKKLDVKIGKKNIFVNLEYGLFIDGEFVADCKMYIEILF